MDQAQAPVPLSVVHLVAEYWPFARTGGLAEAVRGIAVFQAASGIPVTVVMPLYGFLKEQHPELEPVWGPFPLTVGDRTEEAHILELPGRANPRVLFVDNPGYFGRAGIYGDPGAGDYPDNAQRFAFFNRATIEALGAMVHPPVVLHAHDWHTALAPVLLRTIYGMEPPYDDMATVLSVHNAAFQGRYSRDILAELGLPDRLFDEGHLECYGEVNLLKGGLAFSDFATTVSPTHAHELRTTAGGFGLHEWIMDMQDRFVGVRNGIDLEVWNPETDPEIAANYSIDDLSGKAACKAALQREWGLPELADVPVFGMTARMVAQKGIDLILADDMLLNHEAQFLFLGSGETRYEDALRQVAAAAPDRVVLDTDFNESKEHRLMAGSDLLLMPSQFEPCGLTQMRAQIYGALPVARRVGGLADTIEDQVTGFLFDTYSAGGLERGIHRAIGLYRGPRSTWEQHMREAMRRDFGWESSAQRYLDIYRQALDLHSRRAEVRTR
jgi:starch synthase